MFHNNFISIAVLDERVIEISVVANNTSDKMFRQPGSIEECVI